MNTGSSRVPYQVEATMEWEWCCYMAVFNNIYSYAFPPVPPMYMHVGLWRNFPKEYRCCMSVCLFFSQLNVELLLCTGFCICLRRCLVMLRSIGPSVLWSVSPSVRLQLTFRRNMVDEFDGFKSRPAAPFAGEDDRRYNQSWHWCMSRCAAVTECCFFCCLQRKESSTLLRDSHPMTLTWFLWPLPPYLVKDRESIWCYACYIITCE